MFPTEKDIKREFEKGLYKLMEQIELIYMDKERKEVNHNETILLYTNNEFERQFIHLMNEVEHPIFKYQML